MRDVAQPCAEVWRHGGPGAALRSCDERCNFFDASDTGLDDEPQVCARRVWLYRLGRTGIPLRERKLLTADFMRETPLLTTPPLDAILNWALDERKRAMVVMGGTRGVGKTVAACWAISRFNEGMPQGRYIEARDVVGIDFPMRRMQRAPLLVIDQLGHEYVGKNQDWAESQFTSLLDVRYAEMRPTILCGNLDRATFAARYGAIIEDRLVGDGVFHLFKARSMRREGAR